MILVCPECANPYELPDGQIAPLVQVACPHCNLAVIYDFEAANRPALRETGTGSAHACFDAASYFQALGQERLPAPKPVKRRPVESVKPTVTPAATATADAKGVDTSATARRVPAHSPAPATNPVASPSRPTPSSPSQPSVPAANDAGKPAASKANVATAATETPRERANASEAAHASAPPADRNEVGPPTSSGKKTPSLLGNLTPRPGMVQSTAAPSFSPMGRTPSANAPAASSSSGEIVKPNFAPPPSAVTPAKASAGRVTLAPPSAAEDLIDRSAPPKTIQFSTDALTSFLAAQRPEFAQQNPASPTVEPAPAPIELTERLPTQPEIAIRPHGFEDDITAKPGDFVEEDDEQALAESSSPAESTAPSAQGKHRAPHSAAREHPQSRPAPNPREATDIGLDDALDERPPASWGKRLVLTLGLLLLVAGITTSVLAYLQTGSFDPIPFVQTLLTR